MKRGINLFAFYILLCFPLGAAEVQTLPCVVHETLTRNPDVLESWAILMATQAECERARSDFFPQVDVRGAYGREKSERPEIEGKIYLNRTEKGFFVYQPLFTGFRTLNAVKQSNQEIVAACFWKNYVKEQLALQAVQVYLDVLRLHRLKVLSEENVGTHEQTLDKVTILYEGGGGNQTDVDLARGRLARSRSSLHSVEAAYEDAKGRFFQVVGCMPQQLEMPLEVPQIPDSLAVAEEISLQNHPLLQREQHLMCAASASINVAKAEFYPQVNVELRADDNRNIFGIRGQRKSLLGMVVVNYNIFRGGHDRALVRQARQDYCAALHRTHSTCREIVQEITEAWDAFIAHQFRLEELQFHVKSSQEVLEDYRKQFTMARRTLLDVLNMENELFNAKVDLVNGEHDLLLDRYVILANMGMLVVYFF